MNFKQATDALLESPTLEDLAVEMGVSVQTLRQARANSETTAHRSPPKGWQIAVIKLARIRAEEYQKLAKSLTIPSKNMQ